MIKSVLFTALLVLLPEMRAQAVVGWSATTGDVSLSSATTAATIQQPATNGSAIAIDVATVYCSVACNATIKVNGTAATTTAGTVQALLPWPLNTVLPFNFFTASNVGAGTVQGGIIHVPAGATVPICFSPACGAGAQFQIGPGSAIGTAANITISISSITGTANVTFQGRSIQ